MLFELKSFDELSSKEVYRILEIRAAVFVVEQECVYQDLDGKDTSAHHVLGYFEDSIEAYTRIVPTGLIYENYVSIGRVLTTKRVRRGGFGRRLMKQSIAYSKEIYPHHKIKISAQSYLLSFYKKLGFVEDGREYLEDGIPHTAMVLDR